MQNVKTIQLLQGGFKNPHSTSYINCILQICLHYMPFIDLVNSKSDDYKTEGNALSLIVAIEYLLSKMRRPGILSADAIISAFQIDPKCPIGIDNFFQKLISRIPIKLIDIQIKDKFDSLQEKINEIISDNSLAVVSKRFLYIHIDVSAKNIINVSKELAILNTRFFLYAIVQVFVSPSKEQNHYFVTLRNFQGYIRFNDTAVNVISEEDLFANQVNQTLAPIEILIYLNTLDDVEMNCPELRLNNSFDSNETTYTHDSSNPEYNYSDFSAQMSQARETLSHEEINPSYTDIFIKNENATNPNQEIQSNQEFSVVYFDARKMSTVKRINDFLIPPRTDLSGLEDLKNNIEKFEGQPVRYYINGYTAYFSLANYREISIQELQQSQICIFRFCLRVNDTGYFTGKFVSQQKVKHIHQFVDVYFQQFLRIDPEYTLYSSINSHFFVISDPKMPIMDLIDISNDYILIDKNNEQRQEGLLYSMKIPIYLTEGHFVQLSNDADNIIPDITTDVMSFQLYIQSHYHISNPVLMHYDDSKFKFVAFDPNELLAQVAHHRNLRIQDSYNPNDIVFFYNNVPFSYHVRDRISIDDLENEVADYLKLEYPIDITFYDKKNHVVTVMNEVIDPDVLSIIKTAIVNEIVPVQYQIHRDQVYDNKIAPFYMKLLS